MSEEVNLAEAPQVGGDHYRRDGRQTFQHWDLAAQLRMGYFEGQVTKYVTRHRQKNGVQDIEKAMQYLQKLIDLNKSSYLNWLWRSYLPHPRQGVKADVHLIELYCSVNQLEMQEVLIVAIMCQWTKRFELDDAMLYLRIIHRKYIGYTDLLTTARNMDAEEPLGRGYVDQDR